MAFSDTPDSNSLIGKNFAGVFRFNDMFQITDYGSNSRSKSGYYGAR